MITITENRNFIMQMKDDFKIIEVKKSDVIDFGTNVTNGDQRIIFKTKNDGEVVMHFYNNDQFNEAITYLLAINNKWGFSYGITGKNKSIHGTI